MASVLDGGSKYHVLEPLGAGGMGVVHLGTMVSPAGTRKVAIKRLLPKGEDAQSSARITAEAQLVFQLTHANICQVLDLAVNDEGTFIVMELVEGCDLKSLLGETGMDVASAIYIAKEVAQALDYAHRKKDEHGSSLWLVHGDVTPQNILVSREGEVKLADFGIARSLGGFGEAAGPGNRVVAGTRGFMAPEVLSGTSDQRADIYALGITLHVALTGRLPGNGVRAQSEVGEELLAIIARATAARPEERYGTAQEMLRALSAHLARRFPLFTPATLSELVQTRVVATPALDVEGSAPLVSLTGTATFLAPMAFSGDLADEEAVARGTRRVKKPMAAKRGPRWIWGAAFALGASLVVIGTRAFFPNTAPAIQPPTLTPPPAIAPLGSPTTAQVPAVQTTETPVTIAHPATHAPSPSSKHHRSEAPRVASEMGTVTVNAEPWGAVYIDGRRVSESTPLYRLPIAAGVHRIKVYNEDKRAYSTEQKVAIEAGQPRIVGFKW